ncbi:hypothetical protein D3C76_1130020 [compost metagenome]|jgi:hypothetical protein
MSRTYVTKADMIVIPTGERRIEDVYAGPDADYAMDIRRIVKDYESGEFKELLKHRMTFYSVEVWEDGESIDTKTIGYVFQD